MADALVTSASVSPCGAGSAVMSWRSSADGAASAASTASSRRLERSRLWSAAPSTEAEAKSPIFSMRPECSIRARNRSAKPVAWPVRRSASGRSSWSGFEDEVGGTSARSQAKPISPASPPAGW